MNQMFEARHVEKYLGINKRQLAHWIITRRLIKPAIEGQGRGGRNKFSFENMLDLALIKELLVFGIDLNIIGKILSGKSKKTERVRSKLSALLERTNIWGQFKKNRSHYENKGCLLYIEWLRKGGLFIITLLDAERTLHWLQEGVLNWEGMPRPTRDSVLLINIYALVRQLEQKTGMKFE